MMQSKLSDGQRKRPGFMTPFEYFFANFAGSGQFFIQKSCICNLRSAKKCIFVASLFTGFG